MYIIGNIHSIYKIILKIYKIRNYKNKLIYQIH